MIKTRSDLANDLRRCGFSPGDHVVLHSSFKSLGPVAGGPDAIIDALLEVIGPAGNLMMPSFTYSAPCFKEPPFDVHRSPSRTGAVSETMRRRTEARRSFHPTHSVVALGPQAQALTADHPLASPMGKNSPLERMLQLNAKILLLGTRQDSNSMIHYCETAAKVPYLRIPYTIGQDFETAWFINARGETETTQVLEIPGCSRGFGCLEPSLSKAGILRSVKVADAACQVVESRALLEAILELLTLQPCALLCQNPDCRICHRRRQTIPNSGQDQMIE